MKKELPNQSPNSEASGTTRTQDLRFFKLAMFATVIFALSSVFNFSKAQCNSATYVTYANNCGIDYISNVTFATINRTSTCDALTVYNTPNPLLAPGQTYTISVSTGGDTEGVRAWIDYNGDGVFSNTGELILGPLYAGTNPATYTAAVTIPLSAPAGQTRLRVRCNYAAAPADATTAQTWGETEDYCVLIAPNCSGTPAASNAVASTSSICPGNAVNLSLSTAYLFGAMTYQWESSNSLTGTYSSVLNATTTSMNTPTLSASTAYRAIISCTAGGTPLTITTTPVFVAVGAPAISNAITGIPNLCPGLSASLALSSAYSGVGFQWQESNVNIVGPYTNVTPGTSAATSGTLSSFVSPTLSTTMYYQAVLSCTAAPSLSSISVPVAINIQGLTTSVVPYNEGFEGVNVPNFMPNCSWSATSPTVIAQTYTSANTFNRIPNNGSKFAAFKSGTNANGDYIYTNGIQLYPGITYSASLWYTTDGTLGWTEFSMLYGPSQSTTGLINLASATPGAIANTFYKSLSNTFNVSTAGLYYLAVKAKGTGGNYLSFDDLQIIAPCSINSPTLAVSGPTAVCSGQPFIFSATGADSYMWNNGSPTSTANITMSGNGDVIVVGTNSASACSTTISTAINVSQSPPITVGIANSTNTYVCKGSSVDLIAGGAGSNGNYSWSTGTTGIMVTVSPTVATNYTVVGTNATGCSASAVLQISVKNPPTVQALGSAAAMCAGENVTLTATGANTYTWSSNNNYVIGTQIVVAPFIHTTYTVSGADQFKCAATSTVNVNVFACLGINELNGSSTSFQVYPNPNTGIFTLEFSSDDIKSIEVTDLTGRLVLATKSGDVKTSLNISEFSSGIYYVKVQDSKSSNVVKIVKQ